MSGILIGVERFGRRRVQVAAAAAGLAVLLLVAASWMDSLRTELHLEDRAYRPGETVTFSLSVCSDNLLPMRTEDGKPSWSIINEAGDVVADSTHQVFTLELRMASWAPRQCRWVLSVDWDQREWNQGLRESSELAGVPRRGDRVRAGRYELQAVWGGLNPASATFEIAE